MSSAAASAGGGSGSEVSGGTEERGEIAYVSYGGEQHLPLVMSLVDEELSEPYSIFTYRYFVYLWPQLTFLVRAPRLLSLIIPSAPSRIAPPSCRI
jgi:peptide alpha-N-acetyltransferase